MQLFIRFLGFVIFIIGVFQIVRSAKYPKMLSRWKIDESRVNMIVWIARIGGILGIILGIWVMCFVKV